MTKPSINTPNNIARSINTTSDPGAYRIYNVFSDDKYKNGVREEALKEYIYFKYFLITHILTNEQLVQLQMQQGYFLGEIYLAIANCLNEHFSNSIAKKLGYGCSVDEMLEHNKFCGKLTEDDENLMLCELFVRAMGYPELRYDANLMREIGTAINQAETFLIEVALCKRKPDSAIGCSTIIGAFFIIAVLIYWLF